MIEPTIKQSDATGEIKAKVDFWHDRMSTKLYRFNGFADMWRLIRPQMPADLSGFANPQLTETLRATETIGTFMFRGLTAQNPNYELKSYNPNTSQEALWQSERVIETQKVALQYNRKLLRACRSVALMGTVGVEQPWVRSLPNVEGTDFIPRSLLQIAFDPLCMDITQSPWVASIDFVTEEQLMSMAQKMPEVYDQMAIQNAIGNAEGVGRMSPEIINRLAAAGYLSYGADGAKTSRIHYMVTYYGPLKDTPTPSGKDWCIAVLDESYVIRGHESVYPRRPWEFSYLNEFEMESYGYGVGNIGECMQPEMNSNRGRMHDCSTFGLYNMWIADRMSNIKTSQLKVKPWGVVEVDGGTKGLEPIRPQLEAINFGILLEKIMKEEFRSSSGASDNLQAMVTEASATEASIAQTEAVRRLSVLTEMQAEPLVRRHISKMHENNLMFLDQAFWVVDTGMGKPPLRVYPGGLAQDVEVHVKVVTDKDFRPQRNKDIIQMLQILTSIRNDHPEIGSFNLRPWVEELARGVAINPAEVTRAPMLGLPGPGGVPLPNAMDRVEGGMRNAEDVRSRAGELGARARQDSGRQYAGAM